MTDIDPTLIEMYRSNATIVVDLKKKNWLSWHARVYDDFGFFSVEDSFHTKRAAKKFIVEQLEEVESTIGSLTRE